MKEKTDEFNRKYDLQQQGPEGGMRTKEESDQMVGEIAQNREKVIADREKVIADREKVIAGIEKCMDDKTGCKGCPYSVSDYGCYSTEKLLRDAIAVIREDTDRIEELEATVYNLRLYLTALKMLTPKEAWKLFVEKMSGLPGYTEVWKDDA